jgi:hypothetical protein
MDLSADGNACFPTTRFCALPIGLSPWDAINVSPNWPRCFAQRAIWGRFLEVWSGPGGETFLMELVMVPDDALAVPHSHNRPHRLAEPAHQRRAVVLRSPSLNLVAGDRHGGTGLLCGHDGFGMDICCGG